MTDREAEEMLKQISEHYNTVVLPVDQYCAKFYEWAKLLQKQHPEVATTLGLISKSCLFARTVYGGEKPSQTPCPVHKGVWSGCHVGWPGQKWSSGTAVTSSSTLQAWYDAGCRCFQHKCGCTTGWQPDSFCGCVPA